MKRTVIANIGLLATPEGKQARGGRAQGTIRCIKNSWVLMEDNRIAAVGDEMSSIPKAEEIIDAGGRLVTPGLVDSHTHLVFEGWRQHELGLKLKGASYLEILAAGGGILSTVRHTRQASGAQLASKAAAALDEMLCLGTTTCEAKSGYGLNLKDELKSLSVIRSLREHHPVDVIATFMGAHAIPEEYKENREAYIRLLCEEIIPSVAEQGIARFCDVFCETGVFTSSESEQILSCGKTYGLIPKIHADEIDACGGSQLAGKINAISAEHLIVCPPEGISAMAAAGTIAVCLPGTSFYLGAAYAPVRDMISASVPVAIASDFNPGSCPCLNLQLVAGIACLKYRITPQEALTAITLNAAAAIGMAETVGSIEEGKQADLVIWDAPDLDYIFYRMGSNLADIVVKKGKIVRRNAASKQ